MEESSLLTAGRQVQGAQIPLPSLPILDSLFVPVCLIACLQLSSFQKGSNVAKKGLIRYSDTVLLYTVFISINTSYICGLTLPLHVHTGRVQLTKVILCEPGTTYILLGIESTALKH